MYLKKTYSLLLFLIFSLIAALLPIATISATTSSISKPTIPRDRHIAFTQAGNEVLIDWLPASGTTEYRLIAVRQLSGQQPDQTQVDEFYTLTQSHLTDGMSLLPFQACNDGAYPMAILVEISNTAADQLIPSDFQYLLNLKVPLRD